jgi:Predicted secreted protein
MSIITAIPVKKVYADAFKVVTLGADLTDQQKEEMLKYFNVNKNEVNVLEVNRDEEVKYLGGVASEKEIGTKSISCSYVEPTDKGGLNISTNNIYWVSESMIRNALITAGIKNANVKAAAPFKVSGTAALTGILKGFENSNGGKKIDENKKKAANEELVVTGKLGEKIGQDQAANLINDVKKEVIKEKPKTDKEIEKIVINVTNNYNINLSDGDIKNITSLMGKINSLNLDFNQLKDQLNDVTKQLKGTLTSSEAQGFFNNIWNSIKSFFAKIFS